jgi:glycosyltransferase involved in cell wall biosynthesis
MRILQVSTSDQGGGAERSAKNLLEAYRGMGHDSWLAVGKKQGSDPNVFVIPNEDSRNAIARTIDRLRRENEPSIGGVRGLGRAMTMARNLAEPARSLTTRLGHEDFDFPGTEHLLDLPPAPPDIMHLHNLHSGYFDLRTLPALSHRVPTILNVRDGWLLSGHCAFGLGCERWKTGCGECPDLTLFPAVPRDATSFNWERKRTILAASRLYVATPSQWMMDRVNESIIAAGAVDRKVIPNGVDTATFFPGDRAAARAALGLDFGLDRAARVLLVAANALRHNVWKDYETLRAAIALLGAREWPWPVVVLAVGGDGRDEQIGSITLRFAPFEPDSARLADYYRAADVYLHAVHVESFGNVLLEARACGTPVVASSVGGIPEQIRDLQQHGAEQASGILVQPADPCAFAEAVAMLLENEPLRASIAASGLRHVQDDFTLALQAGRFLDWYGEIVHG